MKTIIVLLTFLLTNLTYASLSGKRIGLDAGHGGDESGAVGPTGLKEKNVALSVLKVTKKYLDRDGATVIVTRTTDITVSPSDRTNYLNANNVDKVVSIHFNSVNSRSVNRTMDFVYCGYCNKASGDFAEKVLNRMSIATELKKGPAASQYMCKGRKDYICDNKPGVGQANLFMVKDTKSNATLAEVSFISNPGEEKKLKNDSYIDSIGWSIYAGIVESFGLIPLQKDRPSSNQAPNKATGVSPSSGGTNQSINTNLNWSNASDPDGDSVQYKVYFGTDSSPDKGEYKTTKSSSNFSLPTLDYDTKYYWRIDTYDGNLTTTGDVWNFRTVDEPPSSDEIYLTNTRLDKTSVEAGGKVRAYVDQCYSGNTLDSDLSNPNVGYYLSSNTNFDGSDDYLDSDSSSIGSDDLCHDESEYLTIPADTATGQWYILFIADKNDEITETNENNNVKYVALTVTNAPNSTPNTPSAPNTSVQSSTQINLSWSAVSGASYYRLYQGDSQIYGGSNRSYNNTGLSADTTYYYKLKACVSSDSDTCSDYSSVSSAITQQAPVQYSLTIETPTNGTIDAATISLTEFRLTANADPGYEFSNWTGDCSGTSNPLTITLDSNKTCTANFIAEPVGVKTQQVYIQGGNQNISAGQEVTLTVKYNTSDNDNTLSGLNIRMHFDSSKLTIEGVSNVVGTRFINALAATGDVNDDDNDASTDSYYHLGLGDTNLSWPNQALPTTIFKAIFRANESLAANTTTRINFSSDDGAIGYNFQSTPSILTITDATLDIDNNGKAKGFTDGFLIIRYLLGARGQTLIDGIVASDSTRQSASEIEQYLNDNKLTILDVDGNGKAKGFTDGFLIIRYLLGARGQTLIDGVVASDATRATASEIEAFLENRMPNTASNGGPNGR